MFNPARANNYSSNFVYINYLSDYQLPYLYVSSIALPINFVTTTDPVLSKENVFDFPTLYEESYSSAKNPTFSIAALFNAGDAKWLLSLTHGINEQEARNYSLSSREINSGETSYEFQNSEIYSNADGEDFATTLKTSRIWGTNTNYSLGVFGIYFNNNLTEKDQSTNNDYFFNNNFSTDTSMQRSSGRNLGNQFSETNNSKFLIGIEFSANNTNWDYIGSFGYQKNDNSIDFDWSIHENGYDSSYYSGNTQWYASRYNNITENHIDVEDNPYVLSIDNYFQHSVDWLTINDNLFMSLSGYYSPVETEYKSTNMNINSSYYNDILNLADTTSNNFLGVKGAKNWGFDFSLGYALKETLSDINFLTGIVFTGIRRDFTDVETSVSSQFSVIEYVDKIISASVTFPVYLNYTPAEWFSVFGGFNFIHGYTFNKIEYNVDQERSLNLTNEKNDIYQSRKTANWQSGKSIYLGCELRHQSGLKLQFFFDENFTNIRDWNISLGYHF